MGFTTDLSRGMIIKYNNEPCIIIDKEFYSPGKGGAFNRVRLKNIKTGKYVNTVFKSGEKVEELDVRNMTVQYLYADDNFGYFMNPTSFDQINVSLDIIPGKTDYLHESGKYIATIYEEEVIYIQLPAKLTLVVTDTFDAVKGDTATNASKEAVLETGVKVQVPLFIKNGDKIIINTETGTYFSKA